MTRNPNLSSKLLSIAKSNPTAADVHVNTTLTDFSVAYANSELDFGADRCAPVVRSNKKTNQYRKFLKGGYFRDEMKMRGEGGDIPLAGWRSTTVPFGIDTWSVGVPIDDQVEDNADDPINADREATELITGHEMIRRERSFAAVAYVDSVWGVDVTGNTSASAYGSNTVAQWDDSDAEPLSDIAYYRKYIHDQTGKWANVLSIGASVWEVLKNHPDIIARISGGSNNGSPAMVTKQLVAQLMELEEIIVHGGIHNTDEETASDPFTSAAIIGKEGLLMYRNPNPSWKAPTAIQTFVWDRPGTDQRGTRILRWPNVKPHVDVVEIEANFRHQIVAADMGVRFKTLVG
jgi:hypothetical protein